MGDQLLDNSTETPSWRITVEKKQALREQAIVRYRNATLESGDVITSVDDVSELAESIANGTWKAFDVVLAYINRAVAAHDKVCPLTIEKDSRSATDDPEILFDDALRQATFLDEYYEKEGKTIGPLHGVPMTVKDQFNVSGYDTTLGYVGRAFKPAVEDADIVKILKRAGVIFIAKTNLPQSIMWCETENPLWGLTTHPQNAGFTPGGSSGGEGALLALHGTLLGWGTDLGGSVRIPAHMTGLYSFKPSVNIISSTRIPYQGVPVSTEGQEHVPSTVGPMARTLSSINMVFKEILRAKPWRDDPRVDPRPWNEAEFQDIQTRSLTIGLLLDDGVVRVHPSIERVVKQVAQKLRDAGHDVFEWSSEGHDECIRIMDLFYTADGGEDIKTDVAKGGEPFVPHVEALVSRAPAISVYEYWQLNREKRAAQAAYLKKWKSDVHPVSGKEADIILSPIMPHSAVPHRKCKWVGYTKVWNVLDYPAVGLPAGKVDIRIDPPQGSPEVDSYKPRNEIDKWNWELYDPKASNSMPIGVQLVAPRLQEETVLGAARVVDEVLRR